MKQNEIGGAALAKAVEAAYAAGQTDYSLEPLHLEDAAGEPVGTIQAGDAVIFCCRRGEREIELTDAFTDPAFTGFKREKIDPLTFVILTMYSEKYTYLPVAFAPSRVNETLAEAASSAGLRQLHCAESEKYAHVTFFFNGGSGQPFAGEEDVCIPSPKGVPFDQVPALSLPAVAERVCAGISQGVDLIVTNFANGDVIGHTANDAAKIETACIVDEHLQRVVRAAQAAGYTTFVTADHGNLERMRTPDGKADVAHTENLVAFLMIPPQGVMAAPDGRAFNSDTVDGSLCDVAPSVLAALGAAAPAGMTGKPLFSISKTGKALLIILDGWGMGKEDSTNPIFLTGAPYWNSLLKSCPARYLRASGEAVGLEFGKAGKFGSGPFEYWRGTRRPAGRRAA